MAKSKSLLSNVQSYRPSRAFMVVFLLTLVGLVVYFVTQASSLDLQAATDIFNKSNTHRASSHNLPKLTNSTCLQKAARAWSYNMMNRNTLYHSRYPNVNDTRPYAGSNSGHLDRYCKGYTIGGENVGKGANSTAIFNALLASPTHHKNIDEVRFVQSGVGAYRGNDGAIWITQMFCDTCVEVPDTGGGGGGCGLAPANKSIAQQLIDQIVSEANAFAMPCLHLTG